MMSEIWNIPQHNYLTCQYLISSLQYKNVKNAHNLVVLIAQHFFIISLFPLLWFNCLILVLDLKILYVLPPPCSPDPDNKLTPTRHIGHPTASGPCFLRMFVETDLFNHVRVLYGFNYKDTACFFLSPQYKWIIQQETLRLQGLFHNNFCWRKKFQFQNVNIFFCYNCLFSIYIFYSMDQKPRYIK